MMYADERLLHVMSGNSHRPAAMETGRSIRTVADSKLNCNRV